MKSKTKIKEQARRKSSPTLKETIREANKNTGWKTVCSLLSGGTRSYVSKNLYEIDKEIKEGDTIVIVGKVLSDGNLGKKVRICALSVSKDAEVKIKEGKSEIVSILEEIKKNPEAEGIKILR